MEKFKQGIKTFDVFAKPVSLTYKGQFSFTTAFGGVLSLLLITGFTIGFLVRFWTLFFNPTYLFTARTYSYEVNEAKLNSAIGNTIAYSIDTPGFSMNETSAMFRIQFALDNEQKDEMNYIEGVLCTEMYKDQIMAETATKESKTIEFNKILNNSTQWICPNTTKIKIGPERSFIVSVVACGQATGDVYAQDIACSAEALPAKLTVASMAISTYFEPHLYHDEHKLHLYNQTKIVDFDPSTQTAKQALTITKDHKN